MADRNGERRRIHIVGVDVRFSEERIVNADDARVCPVTAEGYGLCPDEITAYGDVVFVADGIYEDVGVSYVRLEALFRVRDALEILPHIRSCLDHAVIRPLERCRIIVEIMLLPVKPKQHHHSRTPVVKPVHQLEHARHDDHHRQYDRKRLVQEGPEPSLCSPHEKHDHEVYHESHKEERAQHDQILGHREVEDGIDSVGGSCDHGEDIYRIDVACTACHQIGQEPECRQKTDQ